MQKSPELEAADQHLVQLQIKVKRQKRREQELSNLLGQALEQNEGVVPLQNEINRVEGQIKMARINMAHLQDNNTQQLKRLRVLHEQKNYANELVRLTN
mmetsp:Transcript_22941/g.35357  ORF Transcript_22941/g.35357 Transcript_22941/m.35357 type:complete len:99 (+) Transcript_22941:303-599(+)